MKKLLQTLSQKWPEYLLEILVLIIGIYGAFELENWNVERKNRQSEKVILQNLKKEMLANKAELAYTMERHRYSRECTFELLSYFGKDVSTIPPKKLDTLLAQTETAWTFEPRNGYVQSTITSGNINILTSDSLKAMLTSFDGEVIDATQEVEYIVSLLHNRLWPIIDGTVNVPDRHRAYGFLGFSMASYDSDYQSFFNNREVEDILANIAGWHISIQQEEAELMEYFDLLIQLLDKETTGNPN